MRIRAVIRLMLLACLLLPIMSAMAANPLSCGGASARITFEKSPPPQDMDHGITTILTVTRAGHSIVLRYEGNIDFIGAECHTTPNKQLLIVFQAFCGGSGCHDLDNFGIIDPQDLRVLLVPNDTNRDIAAKILGQPVNPIEKPLRVGDACKKLYRDGPGC